MVDNAQLLLQVVAGTQTQKGLESQPSILKASLQTSTPGLHCHSKVIFR